MTLVWNILVVLLMALGPRVMVFLSKRVKLFGILGPVFLCYAGGILFSLIIPETGIAMSISEILVPIAIPLILFSADLSGIKRLAKPTLVSFILVGFPCLWSRARPICSFATAYRRRTNIPA
jgi:uncharacterized membrane protein